MRPPGSAHASTVRNLCLYNVFINFCFVLQNFLAAYQTVRPPSGQTSPTAGLCPTYLCCIYTNINSFGHVEFVLDSNGTFLIIWESSCLWPQLFLSGHVRDHHLYGYCMVLILLQSSFLHQLSKLNSNLYDFRCFCWGSKCQNDFN